MEKAKLTNTEQKNELHRTIWKLANDLRGSVDGWDFKQYVLGFLFYRYISENIADYIDKGEHEGGDPDFKYADLSDEEAEEVRDEMIAIKGYFMLPSQLFENVRKNAGNDENLNSTIANIFIEIENSSKGTENAENFSGIFNDIDISSDKLGDTVKKKNEKLTKILNGIGGLNLGSSYSDHGIDAFGDAYEYLMSMYASNAGKSGGEFFTPQPVSSLLARIALDGKKTVNKILDPACGSGALMLNFPKLIGEENIINGYYGIDINPTTSRLCRLNFILHNVSYNKFHIGCADTLIDPPPRHREEEPYDVIVSNPPYSVRWKGSSEPLLINDPRFAPAGVLAPQSKADMAFIMHSLSWLSPKGTAAIVCFPGVFYRGGAEQKIRKYLIDNNFVEAIIQLSPNQFFGTSIATCILVLKKNKPDNNVLFIDASDIFKKEGTKNILTEENIQTILKLYTDRKEEEHTAALVSKEAIEENGYNLSVSSYVTSKDVREVIDINELNAEIDRITARNDELRARIKEIIEGIEV